MNNSLTEAEWREVFRIRCRSKQGMQPSVDEHKLITRAFSADPIRYKALNADVFDATVPLGSTVKAKR